MKKAILMIAVAVVLGILVFLFAYSALRDVGSAPPDLGGFVETGVPDLSRGQSVPPMDSGGFTGQGQVSGRLWGAGEIEYFCRAQIGDVTTISVTSRTPGMDPRVWLVGPDGIEVAFDDDGGGDGNSLIQGHTLRLTGVYTIRVGSLENRPGDFTLSIEGSCGTH